MRTPELGTSGEYRHVVTARDLATNWQNDVPVLATPVLLWLAERASMVVSDSGLEDGEMTVGYAHDEVVHLAATPLGWSVVVSATLTAAERGLLAFTVQAHDGRDVVYRGTHTRAVVDRSRFVDRLSAKAARGPADHSLVEHGLGAPA